MSRMSDDASSSSNSTHPGGLGPDRDIDTHVWRVEKPLPPHRGLPEIIGETFKTWAWGEVKGWIMDRGPILNTSELDEWEKAGLITRVSHISHNGSKRASGEATVGGRPEKVSQDQKRPKIAPRAS